MIPKNSDYYVLDNGKVQLLLRKQAERRGLKPASDEQVGAFHRRGQSIVGRPLPCCGGRPVSVERWLWMDWYGVPFPKRLRLQSPIKVQRMAGCGCIVRLKNWLEQRRG